MEIKYIVKSASYSRPLFLVRDVEIFTGQIAPFAFRDCEQMGWQITMFDTKEEAIAACEEAKKYDGKNYTPVILETLVEEDPD